MHKINYRESQGSNYTDIVIKIGNCDIKMLYICLLIYYK